MDDELFTISLPVLIPDGHHNLLIDDKYRYNLDRIRNQLFIYKVCKRSTFKPIVSISKNYLTLLKNHYEFLKLKYG